MTAVASSGPIPSSTAWKELSERTERFVRSFFAGRMEIDVQDVVQDTLLGLLRRCRSMETIDDLPALAIAIARRRCIDTLRRSYVSSRLFEVFEDGGAAERATESPSPQESLECSEVRTELLRLRGSLTLRCRMVLDQLILGLKLVEVAATLGTTAGAVRNRWFYCRRQILTLLAGRGLRREDLVD